MVINALKRLIRPEYRIVCCTECKVYYLQRRSTWRGRWEYLTEDSFGLFAMEFARYSSAAMYAKTAHRFRKSRLRLLVVNKCDA